ncbi:hypothetical protein [Rhizobium sp. ZPR3]|uniref:Oxidoreductase n=2 Tax=unclassified Rhizobium TaxID=2613769 RepID=A0AAU7SR89_9HYPH
MLSRPVILLAAIIGILSASNATASSITGDAQCKKGGFLTIAGNISVTNTSDHTYEMSEQEFRTLPATSILTRTPWTMSAQFAGPTLKSVLERVGAQGASLELSALDEFTIAVDRGFAEKYGMILATSRNGQDLTRRDFGPIFSVYPVDSHPEVLSVSTPVSQMVWQLCRITVE